MPASQELLDGNAISFHCTAPGCAYSKRDTCGIVLHMRTHFVYETAEEEMPKATFFCKDGIYQCLDCDRKTNSRISFREHVRHHILPLPYRCRHCGTTVASIPDLRKHSSVAHPKTPLQMYFEDTDGLLGEILCAIGPKKQTFWFPKRVRFYDSVEVESLSDLSELSVSGGVVNESIAQTNCTTDIERTANLVPRLLVRRANAESQQNENRSVVPSENGSGLEKGPSSANASVLEFSAEYNYINAFSCSTNTTEHESNAFLVLNVLDDNVDETGTDCLDDFFQENTERPEIWPINRPSSPRSVNLTNLRSFDDSLLSPHNTDSSCTTRDITLSSVPRPLINEDNRQVEAESNSELTVFSRAITNDSEVLPICRDNTTETEREFLPLDEPTPTSGPGKFVFCDGQFKCLTCLNWETVSEELFRKHVWQHLHGVSEICKKSECQSADCPLVSGLVMLVMNVSNLQSTVTSEPESNTLHEIPPCSSTPTDVGKACSTSSSKRSLLESLLDAEPSSVTGENFASQKESCITKTEKENTDGNLIENLPQRSTEQLRFSAPTLFSLRSKACRHLNFNSDLVKTFPGNVEKLQKDDRHVDVNDHEEEVACIRKTELPCDKPVATVGTPVSEDTISPNRRKQRLMIKQDVNQPVEYCRYSRDSTPLSTVCNQCSYTCNCSVQLTWHVDSCHPKTGTKKRKDFCCTECGFSDSSKQTLIWHMAHHIGQHNLKVYGCKYCSKQSTYMSRIMKHIYRFHPSKVMEVTRESTNIAYMDGIFKCPFCCSGYPWGSLFFRHIEVQHKLKRLADYLANANHRKCCPEVIEFPKYLVLNIVANEVSKDNQSLADKNDCGESAAPGCTENENISVIQQHSENTTDSIKSQHSMEQHSKDQSETGDRSNGNPVSESHTPQDSEQEVTSDSRNDSFCSAKSDAHNTDETRGNVGKCNSKGVQESVVDAETSEKCSKNADPTQWSISYSKLRPHLGKTMQNNIVYNSTKRRIKTYQSPKASKRSFLISPAPVPTLPRNLENATPSDFEKSLPDQFIFSQAIKCPKCYYTDRIRLNLIRHYNGHFTDASKGIETIEASDLKTKTGDRLTFTLWNPKMSDKDVAKSDKLVKTKKKNHAFVSEENDKEPFRTASRRKRSEKCTRIVKRAKLTDKVNKLNPGDSKESLDIAETSNGGSVRNTGNLTSGLRLTAGSDIQKTSTSFGSPPAFGQFLQNHAKKVMATFSCVSCLTTFRSETDYNKHAEEVHSSTYYLCRCCGIMIHGLSDVQVHFTENHPRSLVLVDEWVSASKESRKRSRPFCEVSGVGLPAKKMKVAEIDGENRQSTDKPDSEIESLPKEQKWSSFYGAKLRKHPASGRGPNPTVGATNADFSTSNMISKASSNSSSQTACSTVVSATHTSTGGDTVNALGAPASELMTGMASQTVAGSGFPPPLGNNNLLATLVSNFLATNLMTSQTNPVRQMPTMQVPAMQAVSSQIPSTVEPATSVVMAGQLPVPGMQSAVDNSGFANLLANLLMANLAAGTGMAVPPTSCPNENTAYPLQPGANNFNLLGPNTNSQHVPSVAELIKEAFNPSNCSNIYNISPPANGGNVQNSFSAAEASKDLPNLSHASTLVPDVTHDGCDDNSRQSFYSLGSASKPAVSGSKRKLFSDPDNLYSSEAESTVSIASQRSNNSKSSRSTATSKKPSRPGTSAQKLNKNQFLRDGPESYTSDIERCSSRSSLSTIDLSHRELLCNNSNNSSPLSVAEIFASRAVRMCCNRCEYKTRKLKHFEKHLAIHFDNKQPSVDPKQWKPVRQKCGFCNFQTYLDEEFEEHIAIHMIKKPYQCSYCSFSGFTKASVNRHLMRLHPKLEPKFEKNQNVRLKQTALQTSATKVYLNPVVKLKNISKLNHKAVKSLCTKYNLVKLNLKYK